jgi:4-hydroxyphenylacetate 3-monooxygenase
MPIKAVAAMIRTGQQYRDSIRDGRQVWINGERVRDVPTHPMFQPLVDIRARIYDMAHEAEHAAVMRPVKSAPWGQSYR